MDTVYQPFGRWTDTESSWEETLSEAHSRFILACMEQEQAKEEAVINSFLELR